MLPHSVWSSKCASGRPPEPARPPRNEDSCQGANFRLLLATGLRGPESRVRIGLHATGTTKCTGSVYRARYYDPVRSRFVSEDPLGLGGGISAHVYANSIRKALVIGSNPYRYAHNNPVNRIDPSGLLDCPCEQRAELDWKCFLLGNAISVVWNAPLTVAMIGGGIAFATHGNPAGAGLAIASATLLAANEAILYNMCLRCVPK